MEKRFNETSEDHIYKESYIKGQKLLEENSVQLYDKIAGLTNPIIFASVIPDENLKLSDEGLKSNCNELLDIYHLLESSDVDRKIEEDKWIKESVQLMRKAFREASNMIDLNTELHDKVEEAENKLNSILEGEKEVQTNILVNVVSEDIKKNVTELDTGFVSFSIDELLNAREHIRVPRFQVKKIQCALHFDDLKALPEVPILDYSINNLILSILKCVQEFIINFEKEINTAADYTYFIEQYSEALNAHFTASIVEDERLFQSKHLGSVDTKTVDNLYKFIAEHILSKLPTSFLTYHEAHLFTFEENYVTKLLKDYQSYIGGLCAQTPEDLQDRRNELFPKNKKIWIGLPPVQELERVSLLHYHFSLALSNNEREIFLNNKDSVLMLYGELTTDKFRPENQLGIKVLKAQLELFSDFLSE